MIEFGSLFRRFGKLCRRFGKLYRRFGKLCRRFGNLLRRFGNFFSNLGSVICWALRAARCEECGSEKKTNESKFCLLYTSPSPRA